MHKHIFIYNYTYNSIYIQVSAVFGGFFTSQQKEKRKRVGHELKRKGYTNDWNDYFGCPGSQIKLKRERNRNKKNRNKIR